MVDEYSSSFQELGREAGNVADCDDMIYFAVGPDVKNSWANLSWVAKNFAGKKICFLHVLQPTKMIPSKSEPQISEKQRVRVILKDYQRMLSYTRLMGGGDIYIKLQNIEEGIVMLISRSRIKNLVMGAARPTKEIVYFRSKRMAYVSKEAPESCQIWFIHGGDLIMTRYDQLITEGSSKKETYHESLSRKKTEKESKEAATKREELQQLQETKDAITVEASVLGWSENYGSSSQSSVTETSYSASFAHGAPSFVDLSHGEESKDDIVMKAIARPKETISSSSPHSGLKEGKLFDELYEQLEAELDKSKREAFDESAKRRKAEKIAVEASHTLNLALHEKSLMQDDIDDYKKCNKELTEKIALSVKLMERYKYELDHVQRAAEEVKHSEERSSGSLPRLVSEFSYSEIKVATGLFDPSLKVDKRGYWRIYKGVLHHTEVDIKLLDSDTSKGPSEYRQEVEILSRLRHPNVIALLGACPEALAIIYEHIPNGSLEDRLKCKNNSSPLPWQTRISIVAELCSVLVFLHSNKSYCIVHGDLKAANILLDANFNVKLSHFGLSRAMTTADLSVQKSDVLSVNEGSSSSRSITSADSRRTNPSDTFVCMDPESVITKECTPELDVYSFGIILLRLLTGREDTGGLTMEVQVALNDGNLDLLLDCLAGEWPYVQALQLAKIALQCSDVSLKNQPDLGSQFLGVLQKMKASCQGSLVVGELHSQAPPYYMCPISQDIMQDPHFAADGFTYEKEGIQCWLNSGHNTSPMTNLKLEHTKLVPNQTLRSAIQEWKQSPKSPYIAGVLKELGREAGNLADCDDMVYFAVGADVKNSWPNVSWVARNFAGKKICFLHVLQPTKMIPSKYEPRISEKQRVQDILNHYHRVLSYTGLEGGGDVYIKLQNIEQGIVMLISRSRIKNLVMIAESMDYYRRSGIMAYVSKNAPASCQIWFVHDGQLIKTRYDQLITGGSFKNETYHESFRREKAEKESIEAASKREELQQLKQTKDVIKVEASVLGWSENYGSTSQSLVTEMASYGDSYAPTAPPVVDLLQDEESKDGIVIAQPKETISSSSSLSELKEVTLYDELYEQLEADLEKSKREALEESAKCRKAEKRAVEASHMANSVMKQLNAALREKSLLEDDINDYKKYNKELTEKIALSVKLMERYKYELDQVRRAAEEVKHSADGSSGSFPRLLSEFSYSEIKDATGHFDPSLKIDERGYWHIYKGVLHHTEVDIKLLDSDSSKGPSEYRQEVEILSRLRHPNVVALIGACPEALAIIYEHIPNGSLEDRLKCKNNSSPLPWQTRISIAAELCSVLVFLHSNKSYCIVHGDLKAANILLDANFTVKLSHFGLSRAMTAADLSVQKSDVLSRMLTQRPAYEGSSSSSSINSADSWMTKPSDTSVCTNLESVITNEYTPELDVYSFGIILLRLLTGRENDGGLTKEVQVALDDGNLDFLLDSLAGEWPYVKALQLAKIALQCSDLSLKNQSYLASQVLGVLQKMKASCQGSLLESRIVGELHSQAPPYYICPISPDVMQDPHVAADGFTYEKEGIQGWLNSGHNTSPMTNLKLDYTKLVPNRTLRSAIQEWKLHI